MSIELGLLFGAVACVIGIAGYFGGRQSAAKNAGERWGRLEATLLHMQARLDEIKTTVSLKDEETKNSINTVYSHIDKRFDEHIKFYHGDGG